MNRGIALAELGQLGEMLSDRALSIAVYITRRLAYEERLRPLPEGIETAAEYAAHQCDLAIDRIGQFLDHGPEASVSPSRISAPVRGGEGLRSHPSLRSTHAVTITHDPH
ncbi:hypothetical protein [Chondromyces apiculatus]|uniref:Uncharacterized protein n=1 Tax=Chondromyces apiculatus DSM 436 TaxID=1192034 RepID=A0A017TB68_9BACT|nr:hypothetical protein [Chondromyces apiculatus]EYF06035.1 Hypothetical protein CAP_2225 [Chondromyces apiculatus DSM 436]